MKEDSQGAARDMGQETDLRDGMQALRAGRSMADHRYCCTPGLRDFSRSGFFLEGRCESSC